MPTLPKSFKATNDDIANAQELAGYWGGIRALGLSETIREALRRCVERERADRAIPPRKKNQKNSG